MSKLPETDSITALAEVWQSHDLSEFEDVLVEVTEPVFQRAQPLSVTLPAADLAALRARARQEHIPETALVSRWIHERLHAGWPYVSPLSPPRRAE
ncbi:CopG family antitoxin [uncultured Thiodictyon sp.]|uniref:CopG family antitoxin n=1 Tax=uncultured Thiodictyon sp. TaxID=1846217 RepID=UPI0025D212AD|nr:CopG family antitoxin [uncultured Thiodictyon sp.]